MLALYFLLLLIQDLFLLVFDSNCYLYTFFFFLIIVYELVILNFFSEAFFRRNSHFKLLTIILTEILVFTAVTTILAKSFDLLNIVDFCVLVIKLIISFLIILKLVIEEKVGECKGTFIILLTFSIFFLLQMVSTIFLASSFSANYSIGAGLFIISLSLWLFSSLILWNLSQKS